MVVLAVTWMAKVGRETDVAGVFSKLTEESRKEPGCMIYIGHQSTEDPRKFMFYEQYRDHAALEAHRNAPYFKQYVNAGLDTIMEQRSRELYRAVE